ncbi:hypothetical protein NHQ30_009999 [Ciborinia camelliae]|nr:hypothetical protein NHQ30_009999 [Ciborinia camelliae]
MPPEPNPEESTPLLRTTSTRSVHSTTDHDALLTRQNIVTRVTIICIISVLLIEIGDCLMQAPLARTLEDIICRDYYSSAPASEFTKAPPLSIPESDCKNEVIQGKLAMLKGWDQTLSFIPGLIMSVPCGVLADKVGRKAVLFTAVIGLLLGATVFFQFQAVGLIGPLVGVPLAWWLIKVSNLRVPMMVAVLFIFLGALLILVLPETLHLREHQVIFSANIDPARAEAMEDEESPSDDEEVLSLSKENWKKLLDKFEESRFVLTDPKLLALSVTFLVQSLHANTNQFLLQLASKRLHWSLADASFLIPLASVTNFVQLVLLLPVIYAILSRFHLQAAVKDLLVSRGSALFMALGSFGLAISPARGLFVMSTVLFSLGLGLYPAIRSLLTDLVHPTQVSRLYGVLAVIDTIGGMISSPLVAGAFSSGLKKGGLWSGAGFLVVGVAYATAALLTLSVSVKKDDDINGNVHGVEDEET